VRQARTPRRGAPRMRQGSALESPLILWLPAVVRGHLISIFTPSPALPPQAREGRKGLLLKSLPACGEGFRVGLQAFSNGLSARAGTGARFAFAMPVTALSAFEKNHLV